MQFSTPQRSMAFQALSEAEALTTEYYCIPPFRWQQLRYDLLTRSDQGWEPLPEDVFARTRCLQRVECRQPYDFYRIELNDPIILTAAERENLTHDLYLFLVFILTHEMVHLVRLSTILVNWESPAAADDFEEYRVQGISRRILTASPKFNPVLERFCREQLGR